MILVFSVPEAPSSASCRSLLSGLQVHADSSFLLLETRTREPERERAVMLYLAVLTKPPPLNSTFLWCRGSGADTAGVEILPLDLSPHMALLFFDDG